MKKEDLIAKAKDRGIEIDETQADKYITLSDEELENLAVAGGCESFSKPVTNERAKNCEYFDAASIFNEDRFCRGCKSSSRDQETGEVLCTNKRAW